MATPEGKVKIKIDKWLDENLPGNWRVKPRGGPFGKGGCPDILICWKGIFIAIEVKADDGTATDLQMVQLRKIAQAGGVAALVKGFDLEKLALVKGAAVAMVCKLHGHCS
jgi:hypothetical protein